MEEYILYTRNLRKEFGGIIAVADVDFFVKKNKIIGLIGPNGAGKTTLFNNITGFDTPTEGYVFYKNKDITNLKAYQLARMGIVRTFQNIRLFKEMTVFENIMIGRHFRSAYYCISKYKFCSPLFSIFNIKKEEKDIYDNTLKWLKFFDLEKYHSELAKNLPYGKQKELEIARALATEPEILFLDEPAAGMNPTETSHLMNLIKKINELGITIVIIEHDMKLIMNICDYITVLNYGRKIAEGTPYEIQNNPEVIEAYLGKEH